MSPAIFEKLMKEIAINPREGYVFQGGEPLLYADFMFEMASHIHALQPDCSLKLFTNGTHLTTEVTEKLNSMGFKVCVSMSATGYKGMKQLLSHAVEPTHVFDNIRLLKHKTIRLVCPRKWEFAWEVLLLHSVFPDTTIEFTPDYLTLSEWDDGDFCFFKEELWQLKYLAKGDTGLLDPLQGYWGECQSKTREHFCLETGEIYVTCAKEKRPKNGGCELFNRCLGGNYQKYQAIVEEFKKGDSKYA